VSDDIEELLIGFLGVDEQEAPERTPSSTRVNVVKVAP
jgi:hypothetical protein